VLIFFIIIKDIYYSRTFYQARSQTHFGEGQDKEMFTGRGEQSTNLGRWIGVWMWKAMMILWWTGWELFHTSGADTRKDREADDRLCRGSESRRVVDGFCGHPFQTRRRSTMTN